MRLIDADALKKVITANHYLLSAKNNSTDYGMFTTGIVQAIDNAPTVESDYEWGYSEGVHDTERPQGEWIEDGGNIACSQCHTIWLYRRTDYCPNCGAKMKGGEEE